MAASTVSVFLKGDGLGILGNGKVLFCSLMNWVERSSRLTRAILYSASLGPGIHTLNEKALADFF